MQLGKPRVVSSWLHRDDSLLVTAPEYTAQGLKKSKELFLQEGFSFLYCSGTLWECLAGNWDDWNECGKKRQWPNTLLLISSLVFQSFPPQLSLSPHGNRNSNTSLTEISWNPMMTKLGNTKGLLVGWILICLEEKDISHHVSDRGRRGRNSTINEHLVSWGAPFPGSFSKQPSMGLGGIELTCSGRSHPLPLIICVQKIINLIKKLWSLCGKEHVLLCKAPHSHL